MAPDSIHMGKYASNDDFTHRLTALTWACLATSTLALTGRCTARYLKRAEVGLDDVFAVAAYICQLISIISVLMMAHTGVFSPDPMTATKSGQVASLRLTCLVGDVFTLCFAKFSLLFLYRRIFGMRERWFKIFWWILFSLLSVVYFGGSCVIFGIMIAKNSMMGPDAFFSWSTIGIELFCGFTNLGILILPVASIWSLQLKRAKKIGLTFVFALGSMGSAILFIRVAREIQSIDQHWDKRYASYETAMLMAAEVTILILCACLPLFAPVLIKIKDYTLRSPLGSIISSSIRSATLSSTRRSSKHSTKRSITFAEDQLELRKKSVHSQAESDLEMGSHEFEPIPRVYKTSTFAVESQTL